MVRQWESWSLPVEKAVESVNNSLYIFIPDGSIHIYR